MCRPLSVDLWLFLCLQELLAHVEEGMGKNLAYRCSDAVHASVQSSQSYMIGTFFIRLSDCYYFPNDFAGTNLFNEGVNPILLLRIPLIGIGHSCRGCHLTKPIPIGYWGSGALGPASCYIYPSTNALILCSITRLSVRHAFPQSGVAVMSERC